MQSVVHITLLVGANNAAVPKRNKIAIPLGWIGCITTSGFSECQHSVLFVHILHTIILRQKFLCNAPAEIR